MSITITLHGFPTKQDALDWVYEYEGGLEQHFDCSTAMVDMEPFNKEINNFVNDESKSNVDVFLEHYPPEDDEDILEIPAVDII